VIYPRPKVRGLRPSVLLQPLREANPLFGVGPHQPGNLALAHELLYLDGFGLFYRKSLFHQNGIAQAPKTFYAGHAFDIASPATVFGRFGYPHLQLFDGPYFPFFHSRLFEGLSFPVVEVRKDVHSPPHFDAGYRHAAVGTGVDPLSGREAAEAAGQLAVSAATGEKVAEIVAPPFCSGHDAALCGRAGHFGGVGRAVAKGRGSTGVAVEVLMGEASRPTSLDFGLAGLVFQTRSVTPIPVEVYALPGRRLTGQPLGKAFRRMG